MINDNSSNERRITVRLLGYWEKKRGGRLMPDVKDIDPADIADLWSYCFIAHSDKIGKPGYNFSYLGKSIQEIYDEVKDASGQAIFPDVEQLAKGYRQVIDTRKPLIHEGEIGSPPGDIFKFRQVLLPLGEGMAVQAVFGGMRFLRVVSY